MRPLPSSPHRSATARRRAFADEARAHGDPEIAALFVRTADVTVASVFTAVGKGEATHLDQFEAAFAALRKAGTK